VNNRKGFALVVTLLVTALLVALVVEFISEVYVDTSGRQSFVDGQRASLLAESGIEGAKVILQVTLISQSFTSLRDQWARPLEFPDESGNLRVTIEEESGKLNLNYVAGPRYNASYGETVKALCRVLKLPADDLFDALADWIDSDDQPRPGGGESAYYLARKPACTPANAPLLTFDELAMVKGFDEKTLQKISPFVTVYADFYDTAAVNINTAPKEVLLALADNMTDSLAEAIIDYRKVTPFKAAGELSQVAGMAAVLPRILTSVSGKIYRIRSEATVNGTSRIIETVVNLTTPSAPRTLYWREY
jgi:general secretion pathway protein K